MSESESPPRAVDALAPVAALEPPAATWFVPTFEWMANAIAARLGGPVYLVGSALALAHPGDIDVRVILEEHDLLRLFGPDVAVREVKDGIWNQRQWRMAREQLKQSRRLARSMRCNIDFQIQSTEHAKKYEDKPRLRLDSAPDGFFGVGMG